MLNMQTTNLHMIRGAMIPACRAAIPLWFKRLNNRYALTKSLSSDVRKAASARKRSAKHNLLCRSIRSLSRTRSANLRCFESTITGAACARSHCPLARYLPGLMPVSRLKAILNAADDAYPMRSESSLMLHSPLRSAAFASAIRQRIR